MYQTIVLGLGFLLLFGTAYLIKVNDKSGVLTTTVTQNTEATGMATTTLATRLEGSFACDSDTGCANPILLAISREGEVRMTTSYAEGAEVLQEIGTWKNEGGNGVSVFITGTDATVYASPKSFFVKYVSESRLSGIDFNATDFKDWTRPVFTKQDNGSEGSE